MGWIENQMNYAHGSGEGLSNHLIIWKNAGERKLIRFVYPASDEYFVCVGNHFYHDKGYFCPRWEEHVVGGKSWEEVACPICRATNKRPSTRVATYALELDINNPSVVIKAGIVMQSLTNFWGWFVSSQQIIGPINNFNFFITRNGTGTATNYSVLKDDRNIVPNYSLPNNRFCGCGKR